MKYIQDDRLSNLACRLLSYSPGNHGGNMTTGGGTSAMGMMTSSASSSGLGGDSNIMNRGRRLHGRIEAYTMKRAGNDKKYAADLGSRYVEWQESVDNELAGGGSRGSKKSTSTSSALLTAAGVAAANDDDVPDFSAIMPQGRRKRSHSEGNLGDKNNEPITTGEGSFGQPPIPKRSSSHQYHRSRALSCDAAMELPPTLSSTTSLGDMRDLGTRRLMTDLILTLNMSFPDYDFGQEISPHDFVKVPLESVYEHVQSKLGGVSTSTGGGGGGTGTNGDSSLLSPPDMASSSSPAAAAASSSLASPPSTTGMSTFASPPAAASSSSSNTASITTELWSALDHAIHLADCEVYQWTTNPSGVDMDDILIQEDVVDDYDDDEDAAAGANTTRISLWSFYYLFVNKNLKRIVFFACCETMAQTPDVSVADAAEETIEDYIGGGTDTTGLYVDYSSPSSPGHADDERKRRQNGDGDVDLISEQEEDDDEEEEESPFTGEEGDDDDNCEDFDLDPSAVKAGGIPVLSA